MKTVAPILHEDVERLLNMIDQNAIRAREKLTVHELRVVADVLREWLEKNPRPTTEG